MDAEVETRKKGRQGFQTVIMSELGKSLWQFSIEFSIQEVKFLVAAFPHRTRGSKADY